MQGTKLKKYTLAHAQAIPRTWAHTTEQPLQAKAGTVAPGCRLHSNVELQVPIRVLLLSHDALLPLLPDER